MDLRQLRYLVALAEERHFTRAAAREHVAQPALSQQIRRLEAEVGLPLVDRTTRRVALTDAGELLVARARRAIAEVELARAELGELVGVRTGHVTVGAISTMGPVDLSRLLASFHARHPAVKLSVREQSSEALAELLHRDEIDVAFLSVTARVQSRGLALHRLVTEELVAMLPTDHPLAAHRRVRLCELADAPFVSFSEGARLRELLVSAARAAGFEPQIALESIDGRRIRSLVSRGLGVAVVPRSDADEPGPAVAVADLAEPSLTRDVTLAWRDQRRRSPAAAAFLEAVRAAFA
jgi:LysR family transcriptional regulator, transcription activator of glutamate synthase operon